MLRSYCGTPYFVVPITKYSLCSFSKGTPSFSPAGFFKVFRCSRGQWSRILFPQISPSFLHCAGFASLGMKCHTIHAHTWHAPPHDLGKVMPRSGRFLGRREPSSRCLSTLLCSLLSVATHASTSFRQRSRYRSLLSHRLVWSIF